MAQLVKTTNPEIYAQRERVDCNVELFRGRAKAPGVENALRALVGHSGHTGDTDSTQPFSASGTFAPRRITMGDRCRSSGNSRVRQLSSGSGRWCFHNELQVSRQSGTEVRTGHPKADIEYRLSELMGAGWNADQG